VKKTLECREAISSVSKGVQYDAIGFVFCYQQLHDCAFSVLILEADFYLTPLHFRASNTFDPGPWSSQKES
jgi:hypothetical protein